MKAKDINVILERAERANISNSRIRSTVMKSLNRINPQEATSCAENYAQIVADVLEAEVMDCLDTVGEDNTPEERRLALEQIIIDWRENPEEYGTGLEPLATLLENYQLFLGLLADDRDKTMLQTVVRQHP